MQCFGSAWGLVRLAGLTTLAESLCCRPHVHCSGQYTARSCRAVRRFLPPVTRACASLRKPGTLFFTSAPAAAPALHLHPDPSCRRIKAEILQVTAAKNNQKAAGGALAGKGAVPRRPGALNPVSSYSDRTSTSSLAARPGFGSGMGAGVGGVRRPGHGVSEDGTGRSAGVTSLGAIRTPPVGAGAGVGSRMGAGTGVGPAPKPYGMLSSGGPPSLGSPVKSSPTPSRAGSAAAKPGSPLLAGGSASSPSSSSFGVSSVPSPGVRLPAITSRSSPAASPLPGSSGVGGVKGGMGMGGRLGGAGASPSSPNKPLVTATPARKPTR